VSLEGAHTDITESVNTILNPSQPTRSHLGKNMEKTIRGLGSELFDDIVQFRFRGDYQRYQTSANDTIATRTVTLSNTS
jgi:hypothetical protein